MLLFMFTGSRLLCMSLHAEYLFLFVLHFQHLTNLYNLGETMCCSYVQKGYSFCLCVIHQNSSVIDPIRIEYDLMENQVYVSKLD